MQVWFTRSVLLFFLLLTQSGLLAAVPIAELRARLRSGNLEAEEVAIRELVDHPDAPDLLEEILTLIERRKFKSDEARALALRAGDLILSWKDSHKDRAPEALLRLANLQGVGPKRAAAIRALGEISPAGMAYVFDAVKSKQPETRRLALTIAGELPPGRQTIAALLIGEGLLDRDLENSLVTVHSAAKLARRPKEGAWGNEVALTIRPILPVVAVGFRPRKEKRATLGAAQFARFTLAYRDCLVALANFTPTGWEVHDELLYGLGLGAPGVSATAAVALLGLLENQHIEAALVRRRAVRKLLNILANPRFLTDPSDVFNPLLPAVAILAEVDPTNPLLLPELQRLYRELTRAGALEGELDVINRAMLKARGRERRAVDPFEPARIQFRDALAFLERTDLPVADKPAEARYIFRTLQGLPPEEWKDAVERVMTLSREWDEVKRHFVTTLALATDPNLAKLARAVPSCGAFLDASGKEKAEKDDLDPET